MKPMIMPFITEQTNSVLSWTKLRINPTIIVYGDDKGVPEFCAEHNIRNIKEIPKNSQGVPFISEIIKAGYSQMVDHDYIMYINADILLMDDFSDTVEAFHTQYPDVKSCLLTAIRFDVMKFRLIDYGDEKWRDRVKAEFVGKNSPPDGIDIFLHRKDNYLGMPKYVIARTAFDTWMLDRAIKTFEMSVDMTKTVKPYHHFGMWYQANKVVPRSWSLLEKVSYADNQRLLRGVTLENRSINQCKYYSAYDGDKLVFLKK